MRSTTVWNSLFAAQSQMRLYLGKSMLQKTVITHASELSTQDIRSKIYKTMSRKTHKSKELEHLKHYNKVHIISQSITANNIQ